MTELAAQLEALLFVASEPMKLSRLAAATGRPADAVTAALTELAAALADHGLQLQEHADSYRLVTRPTVAGTIRQFLVEESRTELTKPALETLAIIAYRGPITKSGLETIRGVSSDTMLRNLLQRGLIT